MARKKDEVPSVRVRLDGQLKPGRDDDILDLLAGLPPKQKFPTIIRMLRMGNAVRTVTPETPDDEVLRLVREAEAAADKFFEKYEDD